MNRQKVTLIILFSLLIFTSGCSKYSTAEYEELSRKYEDLQFEYDDLKREYEAMQTDYSDFMMTGDVKDLSDFAHNNPFHSTGFYPSAYCVVLPKGGRTTVRISFDAYGTLYWESNNSCVSCEWLDWDKYDRAPLVLIGEQQGITYLTISNDADDRKFEIVVFVVE